MSSADTFRAVPAEADDGARRAEGRSVWILEREGKDTGVRIIHPHSDADRKTADGHDYWYRITGPFRTLYGNNRDHAAAIRCAIDTLLDWEKKSQQRGTGAAAKKGTAKR